MNRPRMFLTESRAKLLPALESSLPPIVHEVLHSPG